MSGGIAYIYDVKHDFESLCNKVMVDLDSLEHEDEKLLHKLISNHSKLTNSTVANFVLNDFENQLKNFVKVFPKDYKRVLTEKNVLEVTQIHTDKI
jgi:glutamate synthase (NADPH/NADH) large chain